MQTIPPTDLRRAEREPATIPISLVVRSERNNTDDDASAIDFSLEGACVQTTLELVPGEWVGIMLKGEFPNAIPSRVVWVRPWDAAGLWSHAGLQFLTNLTI